MSQQLLSARTPLLSSWAFAALSRSKMKSDTWKFARLRWPPMNLPHVQLLLPVHLPSIYIYIYTTHLIMINERMQQAPAPHFHLKTESPQGRCMQDAMRQEFATCSSSTESFLVCSNPLCQIRKLYVTYITYTVNGKIVTNCFSTLLPAHKSALVQWQTARPER